MKEMRALNHILDSQFQFKNTGIKIANSEILQIQVINSRFNDAPDAVKQAIADSIGAIGVRSIHTTKITGGTVLFVHQNNGGILTMAKSDGYQMHLAKQ